MLKAVYNSRLDITARFDTMSEKYLLLFAKNLQIPQKTGEGLDKFCYVCIVVSIAKTAD